MPPCGALSKEQKMGGRPERVYPFFLPNADKVTVTKNVTVTLFIDVST